MSDQQIWQIKELREEVAELREELQKIKDERNQLLGMSKLARMGFKFIVALGGLGLLHWLSEVIHWLNAPMGSARPH